MELAEDSWDVQIWLLSLVQQKKELKGQIEARKDQGLTSCASRARQHYPGEKKKSRTYIWEEFDANIQVVNCRLYERTYFKFSKVLSARLVIWAKVRWSLRQTLKSKPSSSSRAAERHSGVRDNEGLDCHNLMLSLNGERDLKEHFQLRRKSRAYQL